MIVENTVTRGYTTPERHLDPPETGDYNYCPVCGAICDTIYKNLWDEICGCDQCVKTVNADDVPDCNRFGVID